MKELPNELRKPFFAEHEGGYYTLDGSLFPCCPCWWGGTLNKGLFDKFWIDRDRFEDYVPTMIMLHQIDDMEPLPPLVRKALTKKAEDDPKIQAGKFFSIMVVSNPLIRGTLTAVSWMAGDRFPMDFVSDMDAGLKRAAVLQAKKDTPVADFAGEYKFPRHPSAPKQSFS